MDLSLLTALCLVALASAAPDSPLWRSVVDPEAEEDIKSSSSTELEDATSTELEDASSTELEDASSTELEDASSTELEDASSTKLEDAWEAFKINHDKTYADEKEEMNRKEIFAENLKSINYNNYLYSKGLQTFTMEINRFADLNDSEFMNLMTGYMPPEKPPVNSSLPLDNMNSALPSRVDWRTRGYVTRVKNQRSCGSSWAFSATGALEGQNFRKTGRLVSLSEQQLVDCSRNNNGCKGGWPGRAFAYIVKNRGIDTERSYPYKARAGCCRYRRCYTGATCKSYREYYFLRECHLRSLVASIGPISVAIDASQRSFRFYKRGIYYDRNCKKSLWKLNLAVLAVGYGNCWGHKYWIVKNSWGTNWGMNGYIRMSRNRWNNCGIATAASYPIV